MMLREREHPAQRLCRRGAGAGTHLLQYGCEMSEYKPSVVVTHLLRTAAR
jgi:hypothetical protein